MKFGQKIVDEAVPEWHDHYVHYNQLKSDIKAIKHLQKTKSGGAPRTPTTPTTSAPVASAIHDFEVRVGRELSGCSVFFQGKLRELEQGVAEARRTAQLIGNEESNSPSGAASSGKRARVLLNQENLLLEVMRLGDDAIRLFNFWRLNVEAIRKILKKFKKQLHKRTSILNRLEENPGFKRDLVSMKEWPSALAPSIDAITVLVAQLLRELSVASAAEDLEHVEGGGTAPIEKRPMPALAKALGYSSITWVRLEQLRQRAEGIFADCDAMHARIERTGNFLSFLSRGAFLDPKTTSGRSPGTVRWESTIRATNRARSQQLSSIEQHPPEKRREIFRQLSEATKVRGSGGASSSFLATRGSVDVGGSSSFERGTSLTHQLNLLSTFLYLANYNVCLPTSAEYAEHLGMQGSTAGVIVAMTPVAALLSAVGYSYVSNFSFRNPLLVSTAFLILGNALYAAAWDTEVRSMILMGRFVTGLGGCRAVNRRFIADTVVERHRTHASAVFVAAGAVGMASGPLLAALFSGADTEFYGWTFNEVTGPAWTMCVVWALYAVALVALFREPPRHKQGRPGPSASSAARVGALPRTPNTDDDGSGDEASFFRGPLDMHDGDDYHTDDDDDDDDSASLESLLGLDLDALSYATDSEDDADSTFDDSIDIVLETNSPMVPARSPSPAAPILSGAAAGTSRQGYGSFMGSGGGHVGSIAASVASNSSRRSRNGNGNLAERTGLLPAPKGATRASRIASRRYQLTLLSLWVILWVKLVQEALLTALPLQGTVYSWGTRVLGLLMASLGLAVVPANALLVTASKVYNLQDAFWIHHLLLLLLFSSLPLFTLYDAGDGPIDMALLVVCDLGVFASAQVSEAVVSSFFSKVISKRLAAGTFNSGFLATEAGTFGRAAGNALITLLGSLATDLTWSLNAVFSTVTLCTIMATGLLLNQKHLEWTSHAKDGS